METIICEKSQRIIKNRKRLEEELKIKITNKGKEITIHGSPENEYVAEKVIEALEFGFPFSVALLIKEQDFMFEALNIKDYTKRKDLEKIGFKSFEYWIRPTGPGCRHENWIYFTALADK